MFLKWRSPPGTTYYCTVLLQATFKYGGGDPQSRQGRRDDVIYANRQSNLRSTIVYIYIYIYIYIYRERERVRRERERERER